MTKQDEASYAKTIWTFQCRILITHQAALSVRDDLKCQECGWVMVSAWPAWIPDYLKMPAKSSLKHGRSTAFPAKRCPLTLMRPSSPVRGVRNFSPSMTSISRDLKDFGEQARSVESWDVEWCFFSFSFWHYVMICRSYFGVCQHGATPTTWGVDTSKWLLGLSLMKKYEVLSWVLRPNSRSIPSILRSEDGQQPATNSFPIYTNSTASKWRLMHVQARPKEKNITSYIIWFYVDIINDQIDKSCAIYFVKWCNLWQAQSAGIFSWDLSVGTGWPSRLGWLEGMKAGVGYLNF